MAQIRIEEKKNGGSILPWIIGLLLLALVIWGVAEMFEETDEEVYTEEVVEDEAEPVAPVASETEELPNEVQQYVDYTSNMEGEMGLGHEFSHQALTYLTAAVTAIASQNNVDGYREKSDRAKQLADELMQDPMDGDHADKMKQSAMLLTEMMEDIDAQGGNRYGSEVSKLREEAQAIEDSTLALDQKADIRSFFSQARSILEQMG